jgi:hypothetical protein
MEQPIPLHPDDCLSQSEITQLTTGPATQQRAGNAGADDRPPH